MTSTWKGHVKDKSKRKMRSNCEHQIDATETAAQSNDGCIQVLAVHSPLSLFVPSYRPCPGSDVPAPVLQDLDFLRTTTCLALIMLMCTHSYPSVQIC